MTTHLFRKTVIQSQSTKIPLNLNMALPVARRTVMCNISFDGLLDKSNEAALFIELIKYILFEKNQMPEMFDQLKRSTRVRGKVCPSHMFKKVLLFSFLEHYILFFYRKRWSSLESQTIIYFCMIFFFVKIGKNKT